MPFPGQTLILVLEMGRLFPKYSNYKGLFSRELECHFFADGLQLQKICL
jgi:hypothetical protein